MFYEAKSSRPKPPSHPLAPKDPKVNFMRGEMGPFKCGHCTFFKGDGKPCPWVALELYKDDCCNQYWPIDKKGD